MVGGWWLAEHYQLSMINDQLSANNHQLSAINYQLSNIKQ